VQARATKPADRASLLSFFHSHKGVEIPFNWTTPPPQNEAVKVHFREESLPDKLRAPGVYDLQTVLEEVLC
jgi:phage-related protein